MTLCRQMPSAHSSRILSSVEDVFVSNVIVLKFREAAYAFLCVCRFTDNCLISNFEDCT